MQLKPSRARVELDNGDIAFVAPRYTPDDVVIPAIVAWTGENSDEIQVGLRYALPQGSVLGGMTGAFSNLLLCDPARSLVDVPVLEHLEIVSEVLVNWGDGSLEDIYTDPFTNLSDQFTHTYLTSDTYTITVVVNLVEDSDPMILSSSIPCMEYRLPFYAA